MARPNVSPQKWGRKIEAARSAAEDEGFKIGHAVALLAMLGEHIGDPAFSADDMECQSLGLRVEYLSQQIGRHAEDLASELQKIERAAMALSRGDTAEPDSVDAGNVVRLERPDGDTLKQGGVTYRLWGIDAPELTQTCPDGWPAGRIAATRLQALTAGRSIVCQLKDRDRYVRVVAICRIGGEDLGAVLVREGLAWAFVRYSSDYVDQEAAAKAARLGVHAHGCQPPWEWRVPLRTK